MIRWRLMGRSGQRFYPRGMLNNKLKKILKIIRYDRKIALKIIPPSLLIEAKMLNFVLVNLGELSGAFLELSSAKGIENPRVSMFERRKAERNRQ